MQPIRRLAFVVNEQKAGAAELAQGLMAAARKAGRPPDAAEAAAALVPSAAGWWSGLVMEEKTFLSPAEDIIKLEARLKREQMRRELSALQAEVGRLMAEGAPQAEEKISRLKQLTNALKTT